MKAPTLQILVGALLLFVSQPLASSGFTPLGFLDDSHYWSEANAISNDGNVIVGTSDYTSGFIWNNGVMSSLGSLQGDNSGSKGLGISRDGSVVVGESDSDGQSGKEAFRWEGGIMNGLGRASDSGNIGSSAWAITNSGNEMIVGDGDANQDLGGFLYPVRTSLFWFNQGDPVPIWLPVRDNGSLAVSGAWSRDVSENGSMIIGTLIINPYANRYHAFWSDGETLIDIHENSEPFGDYVTTYGEAVTADGRFIVGQAQNDYAAEPMVVNWAAYVYDTADSSFVPLPWLREDRMSAKAFDISADGSIICGQSSDQRYQQSGDPAATIWVHQGDKVYTAVSLNNLASDNGIDLAGWWLAEAKVITDDGTVVAGWGYNDHGQHEAFRFDLSGLVQGVGWSEPVDDFLEDTQAEPLGNDWHKISWYGLIKRMEESYHWHTEHGYQYIGKGKANDLTIYDLGLGCWSWTSDKDYPFIYVYCLDGGWTFYLEGGDPGNRQFFDYKKGKWINEAELVQ